MTDRPEDFTMDGTGGAGIDDVDAEMDVGAADQDSAVAEYLLDHPYGHRIEELEDRGALGIGEELRRELPDPRPDPGGPPPVARREELARLLKAEEFAERARRKRA
ncbi:hypothetical protein [Nocardiopsis sp. CNT312]|uniref:hypothetical protein n=1 Tax=Nocardiopsis sp. CNT312 TaxID=1137268 RepID=UPI00048ED7E5